MICFVVCTVNISSLIQKKRKNSNLYYGKKNNIVRRKKEKRETMRGSEGRFRERDHGDKRIYETWQNHMAWPSFMSVPFLLLFYLFDLNYIKKIV